MKDGESKIINDVMCDHDFNQVTLGPDNTYLCRHCNLDITIQVREAMKKHLNRAFPLLK